ncbi:MAG: tetratricopeptide repeat protein [Saprospiraceae bacterium]
MKELIQLNNDHKLPEDELNSLEKQVIQNAINQEQNKARWASILETQGLGKNQESHSKTTTKTVEMKKRNFSGFGVLRIAAAVLLAFFCGWWYFQSESNSLQGEVYAAIESETFSPDGSVTRGGASGSITAKVARTLESFEKEQYDIVVQELAGFDNLSDNEYMLLGYSYAKNKKPEFQKAIDAFEKVKETKYRENQVLMMALCHIQLGHFGIAKELLSEIINNPNASNKHIEKAKKLQAELDKQKK